MMSRTLSAPLVAVASAMLMSSARAHHAMDNALPVNAFQGFLSGIAHPVIGVDHLLFVLAVGAACCFFRRGAVTIVTFAIASLAGAAAHLFGVTLAYPDAGVALTLIVLGVLFFTGRAFLKSSGALGLFAVAGIVHGYAYAEAIVGAEPTPLAAYLVGFTAVQLAISFASFALARYAHVAQSSPTAPRAIGAVLSAAGAAFLGLSFAQG